MNHDTIRRRALEYDRNHVVRGYYFEPDHGDVVCRTCLNKLIKQGLVSKDDHKSDLPTWHHDDPSAERDVIQRCEASSFRVGVGCCKIIDGLLTEWGAFEELRHFEEHGMNFRRGDDCYIWDLMDMTFVDGTEYKERLYALAAAPGPRSASKAGGK